MTHLKINTIRTVLVVNVAVYTYSLHKIRFNKDELQHTIQQQKLASTFVWNEIKSLDNEPKRLSLPTGRSV